MSKSIAPEFKVGQRVALVVKRQGAYRGGGSFGGDVKATKVMEIGSIEVLEEDMVTGSGYVMFKAGTYYHLRRPGGKGKGGNVLWAEKDLSPVE